MWTVRTLVATALLLGVAAPSSAVFEFDGVRLRGFAYNDANDVVRVSLALVNRYDEVSITTHGAFDCRNMPGRGGTCPSPSRGIVTAEFGFGDVMGNVSSATFLVQFPDGATCDIHGITPLPLGTAPSFFKLGKLGRSPLLLVSGRIECRDAAGSPTTSADFFTTGTPLRVPVCNGHNGPVCA
jgi:hypothetical protein